MSGESGKKKRIRGGHRSSLKRLLFTSEEILKAPISSADNPNIPATKEKALQLILSLKEKLTVLKDLDDDILDGLKSDDDFDKEIEETDVFRETTQLTIVKLETKLSEIENMSDRRSEVSTVLGIQPSTLQSPLQSPVQSPLQRQPTPISANEEPSTQQSESDDTNVNTHHTPSTGTTSHSGIHVKLPKLTLKTFHGEYSKWQEFWDSYNSAIHSNASLTDIDKFNYLKSLLDGSAANSISGLPLSSSNYEEAISILKKRFGNRQQIINRHMKLLLNLNTVTEMHNLRALRQMYDVIESNVRSLQTLGVPSTSYGNLLSTSFMDRIPHELKIIIGREVGDDDWEFERVLGIMLRELEARERTVTSGSNFRHKTTTQPSTNSYRNVSNTPQQRQSTTTALYTSDNNSSSTTHGCTYCSKPHTSNSCRTVSNIAARKEILKKTGRCYICLRRNHIGRNCSEQKTCPHCNYRHHISICPVVQRDSPSSSTNDQDTRNSNQAAVLYTAETSCSVLLPTAIAEVYNPKLSSLTAKRRSILDTGSQRSYITKRLQKLLKLETTTTSTVKIKTFGSTDEYSQDIEVVKFMIRNSYGNDIMMTAFVVPIICQPLKGQNLDEIKTKYHRYTNLKFADSTSSNTDTEIDILIGSDQYWNIVTGRILRGESGPTAMETKLGWVFSGPSGGNLKPVEHILVTTLHISLDQQLKQFWEIESLGLQNKTAYDDLTENIRFIDHRYEVMLPWKQPHPILPDNFQLCSRRLTNLLKRLRTDTDLLKEYDKIIREQVKDGILEEVESTVGEKGAVHYLPHHAVIRRDKLTTKLRIVYDASAKTQTTPSLNDCLYSGPPLNQKIFDIILRFRTHRIALIADIEKAFLMVSMREEDRDVLRFLWVDDIEKDDPKLKVFRFTRVVFGVSSSPFLLNATIKYHMEKYYNNDPEFVQLFMRSIYVDDLTTGAKTEEDAFNIYKKSKSVLSEGGFNLRKFVTNSAQLKERIMFEEAQSESNHTLPIEISTSQILEEDETFTKCTVGSTTEPEHGEQKILGVCWKYTADEFVFDLQDIYHSAIEVAPTKRNVVSIASRFFDPLGFISPLTIRFKILFQELCKAKVDWDEALDGEHVNQWNDLTHSLSEIKTINIPRCYFMEDTEVRSCRLVGFCDASQRAYAAVVYLHVITTSSEYVKFVASKTRVAPLIHQTIPRLELLSALILSRLISTIQTAIQYEVKLEDPRCFTDSKVSYYWIVQESKEWKPFIQNRVNEIRTLVPVTAWAHCHGLDNPADIPSRGKHPKEFLHNRLWTEGPEWIINNDAVNESTTILEETPVECISEMKAKDKAEYDSVLLVDQVSMENLTNIINVEEYSNVNRLYRITAYVMRFILKLKARLKQYADKTDTEKSLTLEEIKHAEILWIKEIQKSLRQNKNFNNWKQQFDVYEDESHILRCRGRLANSSLPDSTKFPILLDSHHHLTSLIVRDCHKRVMHSGTKATLTELRSRFWIIKGRQFVRRLIHGCVTCRRYDCKPYDPAPAPQLPDFRVTENPPFSHIGVDFAGPLYVKTSDKDVQQKVWICLFTCCSSRAVHLELVPDLLTSSFLRCFQRFTARRGVPVKILSDNGKTFTSAAKHFEKLSKDPDFNSYFQGKGIHWSFNLEKAPWWGGIFERLIKSTKRCLKKTVGGAKLTYEELETVLIEAEAVLNSRPLSYVSTEDVEEPLTPFHLLYGRRVTNLPDVNPDTYQDPDYEPTHNEINKRMVYLQTIINHFWERWKTEYLLELRSTHRLGPQLKSTAGIGDVVIILDQDRRRGQWKLGRIEQLIKGNDDQTRGAVVRVHAKDGKTRTLRRPVQHLYPMEIPHFIESEEPILQPEDKGDEADTIPNDDEPQTSRPKRAAAKKSNERRQSWMKDL